MLSARGSTLCPGLTVALCLVPGQSLAFQDSPTLIFVLILTVTTTLTLTIANYHHCGHHRPHHHQHRVPPGPPTPAPPPHRARFLRNQLLQLAGVGWQSPGGPGIL